MSQANQWYWKQSINTSVHYLSNLLGSEKFLRLLVIAVTTLLFTSIVIMISWLSNMDNASPEVWDDLLKGVVHRFLFEPEVLVFGFLKLIEETHLHMFFNIPGLVWSIVCFGALGFWDRRHRLSPHQLAGIGYALMLVPYLAGLFFIDMMQPEAKKVGPVIAFMVFPVVYMAIPLAVWVLKKIKHGE